MRVPWNTPKETDPRLGRYAAAGLAVFAVFCFVKVYQNVTIDNLNRKNGELRQQLKDLKDEYANLTVRVEELQDPDRINNYAINKFNFIQPPKFNLYLKK